MNGWMDRLKRRNGSEGGKEKNRKEGGKMNKLQQIQELWVAFNSIKLPKSYSIYLLNHYVK